MKKRMERREFLKIAGVTAIAVGLTACGKKTAASQLADSTANSGNAEEKEDTAEEDIYKVDIEEEGTKAKITCKRGGNKIEQSISSYNHELMNEVAAEYAEAFGEGKPDEVAGKNWEKIEHEVTLSEKIIYGEEFDGVIKIYVPDTTTVETVHIRLIAEDESTVEFDVPVGLGVTTDTLSSILGTRCISVGYQ